MITFACVHFTDAMMSVSDHQKDHEKPIRERFVLSNEEYRLFMPYNELSNISFALISYFYNAI